MQSNVYKSINSILYDTYTHVASDSVQKASVEAKGTKVSSCSIRINSVAQVVVRTRNEYITNLLWDDHTFQCWKFVWDEKGYSYRISLRSILS